ncbi:RHS repeat-associated core domain-containing protein [Streptomyces sp. NPDC055078]
MLALLATVRRRRRAVHAVVVALVLSLMVTGPAGAANAPGDKAPAWSGRPGEKPVPGTVAKKAPPPRLAVDAKAVTAPPAAVWPMAGTGTAAARAVGARAAGGVEVLDRAAARKAGINGVLFRVPRAAGKVAVDLDYSGFRTAFGGDYASRLRVVDLATRAVLPARNDTAAGRIRVTVDPARTAAHVPGESGPGKSGPGKSGPGKSDPGKSGPGQSGPGKSVPPTTTHATTYALIAGAGSEAGTFSPTSLAPSATWAVGIQSGDFSWNYPVQVPPAPGPVPNVALSYTSSIVDGRTASTNNQSSWVGEGFGYEPGFIERTYTPCAEDGHAGKGDLCWDGQSAHLVLPGATGELVWDVARNTWRVADDDGWRVELGTGATNGDNDGEYWTVTGPDGTRYTFGRTGAAKSAWTVPVYGNEAGEPCHGPSFATSWCLQAYRWTLETVTGPHGDTISYTYDTEINHYGRNSTPSDATEYVRGGRLARIEYGGRADGTVAPSARVLFTSAPRCVPGSVCDPAVPANWPDTPWDLNCSGGSCPAAGPTFWSTVRLSKITTQVLSGGRFTDVDSWTLNHIFPDTADLTTPTLWLRSVQRTGHTGGTPVTLPEVRFDGIQKPNRITTGDGLQPMNKWRLTDVHNETGGTVHITYAGDTCDAHALPRQDQNAKKCFPTRWLQAGGPSPRLDFFAKYVVGRVDEIDRVGGSPTKSTRYEYIEDGAAWRHDDAELVPTRFKTWGSWRGYQRVKVRTGEANGRHTLTEHLFLRGMHGDLLLDGTRREVRFTWQGTPREDRPGFAGFARETVVRDPVTGAEISAELHEPWLSEPTAVRNRESGPLEARILKVVAVQTRTALAAGGSRTSETRTEYDAYGSPVKVHDRGDVTVADDDVCTTTSYSRNTTAWILNRPGRVLTAAAPCPAGAGQDPAPADVVSDERTYYDGATEFGTPPVKGDVTRTEELASWDAGRPVYATVSRAVHDVHGRVTEAYDALGAKTLTAYQPATGGPLEKTTVTNPLGHTTVTEAEPARGLTTATVDPNGRRATRAYDALGRLTTGWRPGRPATASPTVRFEYRISADAPAAVTTRRLLAGGDHTVSHTLYDGLLRERQTQEPTPSQQGRMVTDTAYDAGGRVLATNATYYNPAAAAPALLVVNDDAVPSRTVYEYDGAGRTTAEILRSAGAERHRTTYTHGGDRISEDPPTGGTPVTRINDVRGRLTELRQYTGDAPSGAHLATAYTYTKAGRRASVTDPAGNIWRFRYDLRGRQTAAEDPDKGTATMTYDDKDRLSAVTDARGTTLAHTYDALDRRTGLFEGSPAGRRIAEWTYDSAPRGIGEEAAAIRYDGGAAYRTDVLGYNDLGLPTGSALTVPAREGALAGRYESTTAYNQIGQVTARTLPAAGGLPAETLMTGYTPLGRTDSLVSAEQSYVTSTGYGETGRVDDRVLGGRMLRSYAYDPATRLVTGLRTQLDTGAVTADTTVGHDPAGNIVSSADAVSGDRQCFRSDSLRRLTDAWTTATNCAAGPSTAALGGPAPYWHTYGYDQAGNRTREIRHAAGGDTVRDYGYPAPGTAGPHRLQSVTTGTRTDRYGYDAAGNTVTRPGQTLTWDPEGRLAQVTAGAVTTSFVYDADGERLVRRDPGGTTLQLGDDTELRLDTATGTVTGTRYYAVDGTGVAVRTPAGVSWLTEDQAGTADTAVNAADLTATVRRHLPYGAPRGPAGGTWPGERGFVGGTLDATTGLTHLGARQYDPDTGAFLSVDPILDAEDPRQLHGYAYAGNSPVSDSDPTGLTARPVSGTEQEDIVWDSTVTAYRSGGDGGSAPLYSAHGLSSGVPAGGGSAGAAGDVMSVIDDIARGRGGWSPEIPPGYERPPGAESPGPAPGVPANPPSWPGAGSSEGSGWSPGSRVLPSDGSGGRGGRDAEVDVDGSWFPYGWDLEFRELWEYDRCKPWNPCDKPGFIEGSPPRKGKDKKKGSSKSVAAKAKDKKSGKKKHSGKVSKSASKKSGKKRK